VPLPVIAAAGRLRRQPRALGRLTYVYQKTLLVVKAIEAIHWALRTAGFGQERTFAEERHHHNRTINESTIDDELVISH
jgi:hypothetical protein